MTFIAATFASVLITAVCLKDVIATTAQQRQGTGSSGAHLHTHLPRSARGDLTTVSNRALRTDTSGSPILAMDGGVVRANGSWYLYGLSYGQCRYVGHAHAQHLCDHDPECSAHAASATVSALAT
jgi:hypothetical protein